jgi:DNA-binding response OmpR family regulator
MKLGDTGMQEKALILIAEDDLQLRELLQLSLEDRYRLVLAEDGLQAVEYVKSESPDLILIDIKMPRLNGWDAIREIRSRGIKVPIIVITGFTDSWGEMDASELGVNKYLPKPFNIIELRELINEELARTASESKQSMQRSSEIARELYIEGISWWEKRDAEKALRCFNRAHELNPGDPHITSYLGLLLVHSGDRDEGFRLCRRALKSKAFDEELLFNLGQAYLFSSKRNKARLTFLRGARVCENKRRFLDQLAKIGIRRSPVISFLSRDNLLNRWLGKLTYRPGTFPAEDGGFFSAL